ncbi:MAG: hypothetical protein AMXMBFR33_53220 [Candidatus Xenobia bacterium]|jgi:hypothetical protein
MATGPIGYNPYAGGIQPSGGAVPSYGVGSFGNLGGPQQAGFTNPYQFFNILQQLMAVMDQLLRGWSGYQQPRPQPFPLPGPPVQALYGVAIGGGPPVQALYGVAIGGGPPVQALYGVAIGGGPPVQALYGVAIGGGPPVQALYGVALGNV